jgi:PAS domain S-box-containing protein
VLQANGSVGGFVIAFVEARRLAAFEGLASGEGNVFLLFARDGTLLAAGPRYAGAVGLSFIDEPPFNRLLAAPARGILEAPDQAANRDMLFAHVARADFPFVAAVGRDTGVIFADWRTLVYEVGALLIFTYALLGLAAVLLYRQVRRLADAGNLLREVLDAIPVNVSVKNGEGRYVLVNAEHARYLGATAEKLIGQTSLRLVGSDYWAVSRSRDRQVIETGKPLGFFEERYREKDGSLSYWLSNKAPVLDAVGRVKYLVSVGVDLTAQRRAEEALHEAEQLAREVIDTALDAFIRIDDTGRVLEWNTQAEAIFGWSRAEMLGSLLADTIIPPDQRDAHHSGLTRFRISGSGALVNRRVEVTALRRDGPPIRVEMAITPVRGQHGWTFNAFLRDITQRLAAEEALAQAQKMQALGQLTGGVAHDFNNLLTVIVGGAEFLSERLADQPQLREHVAHIDTAARRAAILTQRLLAFGRRQPLHPRLLDLNEVLAQLTPLIRTTVGEQIKVEMGLAAGLWPVEMDENQLANALLNLAANARDAMPNGGSLTLSTANVPATVDGDEADAAEHDRVAVAVADTGAGMAPEVQARIFEPFFTTKAVGKGSGLGLSMVYGFVQQSHGEITVNSAPGSGTAIVLSFPRALPATPSKPDALATSGSAV